MRTNEVVEAIERERARLLGAADAIDREVVVNELGWTAKDALAASIHWVGMIAFGMGAKLDPPSYVIGVAGPSISGDEWNARAIEHYGDRSFEQVRAEFIRNSDALLEQARLRSDEEMNATDSLPWAGERPLWDKIGVESFLYNWPLRTEQIERASTTA